jgi:replication factor C subunit 3/5
MSLWCDKYRPKTFDELDYQLEQAELLRTIVASGDFPHFLIFGPSGAGKKTRITCLLHALYGDGVQSLRIENHEYETPSRKKLKQQQLVIIVIHKLIQGKSKEKIII